MKINNYLLSVISIAFFSFFASSCVTKNSNDSILKQETDSSSVMITPTPVEVISPKPTITETEYLPSLEAPINGLEIDEWSVFPEAANLLKCHINFITQTIENTIWFGCGSGVVSFDGSNWNTYASNELFNFSVITVMSPAPDGSLWLGTENDGLIIFDGNKWEHISSNDGLVNDEITSIAITSNGIIWVSTKNGISQFDGNKWHSHFPEQIQGNDYISSIAETADGKIWFGTNQGMILFLDGTDWRRYTKTYGEFGSRIVDMAVLDNSLWVVRGKDILHIFGDETDLYQSEAFEYSPPLTITVAKDGSVWVGSWGGYKIATLVGSSWNTIGGEDIQVFTSTHNNSLPFDGVFSIFEDSAGAFWFGTEWGAYKYER